MSPCTPFLTVICFSGMKSALCLTRSKILARWGLMKASSRRQRDIVQRSAQRATPREEGAWRRTRAISWSGHGAALPSHVPGPVVGDQQPRLRSPLTRTGSISPAGTRRGAWSTTPSGDARRDLAWGGGSALTQEPEKVDFLEMAGRAFYNYKRTNVGNKM